MTAPDDLSVALLRFLQPREMSFRNDQNVGRSLRVDIFKRKHVLVFINLLGWNLTAKNTAEKTVRRVVHAFFILAEPRRHFDHVGTAAIGCPAERSSAA